MSEESAHHSSSPTEASGVHTAEHSYGSAKGGEDHSTQLWREERQQHVVGA